MVSTAVLYGEVATEPPFSPDSLPPGTRIASKYVLDAPIGWGEHSVVYAATHQLLQRKAAVKVLARTDPDSIRRFAREARLAGSLRHANIVEVYEVGQLEDGRAFLAMELLEGETLEDRLARVGPFSIEEAMRVGMEVLFGLAIAHENHILHRDLRPQNIFLAKVRGEEVVKLVDFGVSRHFGRESDSMHTRPGTFLTGIQYVAPEQLYEDGTIDQRTDLYAVGVLLYRLLTGVNPFDGKGSALLLEVVEKMPKPPSQRRPELTADVDRVILSALAKDKEQRFADADAMREALRLTSLFSSFLNA